MSQKILLIAVVLAAALVGWLCYYFSDKMVIRRQLAELAQDLAKEEQEQPIRMALKMGRVKAMLATTCQAAVPEKGYAEELEQGLVLQYVIYYRSRYTRLTVHSGRSANNHPFQRAGRRSSHGASAAPSPRPDGAAHGKPPRGAFPAERR